MGVKKLKSRNILYSPILSKNSDDVRRLANKTVRAAREAIHHSENLVEKSRDVLERADKVLRNSFNGREKRRAEKQASGDSHSRKRRSW